MEPKEVFSFCPKCGTKFNENENIKNCSNCGFRLYINSIPTVALVLTNKEGKVLLLKRKVEPQKDKLDLIGGFLELNETFEDAVLRECKEEIDVNVHNLKFIGTYHDRYLFNGLNYYIVSVAYSAIIEDESLIKLNNENSEFEFIDVNAIDDDEFAFKSLGKIIEDFKTKFLNK